MKKILTTLVLILALATGICAQTLDTEVKVTGKFEADTATDAETLTFTFPGLIHDLYYYSWQVVADSLTGATAGTAYLQETLYPSDSVFTNLSGKTLTIDGAGQSATFFTGTCYGGRQQVQVVTTGTQTLRIRIWYTYVKVK